LSSSMPVEVKGKRIENVEDVKQELARRPGSNILIEEKQITESRALNLQDVLQFAPRRSVSIAFRRR
jgi:iron complex outermembrane receptor protein